MSDVGWVDPDEKWGKSSNLLLGFAPLNPTYFTETQFVRFH
jgi:hypothetical protein